jgi:hypothetical protein
LGLLLERAGLTLPRPEEPEGEISPMVALGLPEAEPQVGLTVSEGAAISCEPSPDQNFLASAERPATAGYTLETFIGNPNQ